jgi:hypothetical protein
MHEVAAACAEAVANAGCVERHLVIAGRSVMLRFAGPALLSPVLGALEHAAGPPAAVPALVVNLFDNVSTGGAFDPGLDRERFVDESGENGAQWLMTSDRVQAGFHGVSGVLSVLDRAERRAYWWVRDASDVAWFEQAAPLRALFHWWLQTCGVQLLHAAAIETPHGALLLAGKGGSGKSTSALACATAGLGYIADDYCLLDDAGAPTVFSLFSSAKVPPATAARFPSLVAELARGRTLEAPKTVYFLASHPSVRVVGDGRVRALVFPRVSGRGEVALAPMSSAQAFAALAPSTIFQLPGAQRTDASRIAALVRRVPAFVAEVGPDLATIPSALVGLAARLAGPPIETRR